MRAHSVQADEGAGASLAPQADRLQPRADGSRFAAVRMNRNLRLDAAAAKAGAQKIHLRLDRGQIALRASLQDEARTQRGEAGSLGHVQKDVARQHRGQSGQNLLGAPALALEVDDLRLQKDRAAVAEDRHGAGGEGRLGIPLDRNAKAPPRSIAENSRCRPSTACSA